MWAKDFPEILPPQIIAEQNLYAKSEAIKNIHFPDSAEAWQKAKVRLGFEEIFEIQLRVMRAKIQREQTQKNKHPVPFEATIIKQDLEKLPFILTNAQKRSLHDILQDFTLDRPMHRLLQGDVGSGKTIVCFLAALQVVRANFQVVILAPTEILAKQHFDSLHKFGMFDSFGLGAIQLLTGSVPAKQKIQIKQALKAGQVKVLVGTHAVLTEDTIFADLGLAIIDEQHRFGVKQRTILSENYAHTLALTATPIPRSLALTIYGDQDLSIINEKPAGRKEIITRIIANSKNQVFAERFIDDQIQKKHQIFWVCPLVDESDKIEAKNVKAEYERIKNILYPQHRVGFLHGKMKPADKERIMKAFKQHEFDILVSTSVIEVGVDIPNSTVMVIENAERFGLAQLHQFRGRIGRNDIQSYCFLMVGKPDDKNKERLRAMVESNDGFYLSEVDMRLRGSGEIYGLRQSGLPDLKCADFNDITTMKNARDWATKILEEDITLSQYPALQKKINQGAVYF